MDTEVTRSDDSGSPARPEKRPRLDVDVGEAELADVGSAMNVQEASGMKAPELKPKRKSRKQKRRSVEPYSPDDVLWHDILSLLGNEAVNKIIEAGMGWVSPLPFGTEIELVVSELSSSGDSLSVLPPPHPAWVVVVPFALPGERIRARVYRSALLLSMADLVKIESANEALRDMERVKCKYFGRCAGCQYQMMSYVDQLNFKQKVVDKAYQNFSSLSSESVPRALATIASPSIYGYRTKITPHFDVPPKKTRGGQTPKKEWELRIGFTEKGRRSVMDIEECPIATPVLNDALGLAREAVQVNIHTYTRGATLLLRDSMVAPAIKSDPPDDVESATGTSVPGPRIDVLNHSHEQHVCITDHKATVRERVGTFWFEFPAGSFFQNNNSVLEPLTTYVRDAALGTSAVAPTHLVDAYCGSGLFAITLSSHFSHVAGVEISADSICYARHNASLNDVPRGKCTFHVGQAEAIFDSVRDFPPARTVVIVDPPRKGCDTAFMDQLINFGPATVVYVSCNVHTQARDVGIMLTQSEGTRYQIESLRGIDLFPHTAHVESVAVLRRL